MANIIIPGTPPDCPLCNKKMKTVKQGDQSYYTCFTDMVSINVTDPICGNWKGIMNEVIPCPVCNTAMKYFVRSDGWFKAKCPKEGCGSSIDSGD